MTRLLQQIDAANQQAAAADAVAAQQAHKIARHKGELRAMDEAGRRVWKGAGIGAEANSPGIHHHRWEGAHMRDADSLISLDFTCDSAITQPYEEAAADGARWAGYRGGDGVLVGRWRFQSRCDLESRKREVLANIPGSAIHALYDCRTGVSHMVLLRSDRVAVQHEVANPCRGLWVSSLEVDGPEVFVELCRWTRKLLCPVEVEIRLRRIEHESSFRNAAAAAEQREKEAVAAVEAAAAKAAAAEVAAAEAAAAEAAAAEAVVAEMKAVSLIASTVDAGVLPTAVPVPSTAPPEGQQQHVHDAIETAGQIAVYVEPDSPLVDDADVVPSTIFALGDVHLLEEDGGAMRVDNSSSSTTSHDDLSSHGGFGNSGDINRHGSWIMPAVLPPVDFGDVGEVHLLEEQDTDEISRDSYSRGSSSRSSSSSSSSDPNGDATNNDVYQTGRDGGEAMPRAGKGESVLRMERPFDRGKGFGVRAMAGARQVVCALATAFGEYSSINSSTPY